jgi:hypothetical protein
MSLGVVPEGSRGTLICGAGGRHDLQTLSWTPPSVTLQLPEAQPADCGPPHQIELVIPRPPGASDTCRKPIDLSESLVPPPPVVRVPTVVALFENAEFRGRALVAVPNDSPIGGSSDVPLNRGGVAAALAPVSGLGGAIIPGAGIAGSLLTTALLGPLAAVGDDPGQVQFARADANNQISDFFDIGFQFFPHISAEDIMSSLIVIGEPDKKVLFFNAPDASDREGAFEVTIPARRLVQSRSLAGESPQTLPSDPPGAIRVLNVPDFVKGFHSVKKFESELSSIKFA